MQRLESSKRKMEDRPEPEEFFDRLATFIPHISTESIIGDCKYFLNQALYDMKTF